MPSTHKEIIIKRTIIVLSIPWFTLSLTYPSLVLGSEKLAEAHPFGTVATVYPLATAAANEQLMSGRNAIDGAIALNTCYRKKVLK